MAEEFEVPVQFWALLLGWAFTLYLQRLSNRRSEALKRKDKLVDRIESLIEWVGDEVAKGGFSAADAEASYTSLLTQIELRIHQFNSHVKKSVISIDLLAELRRIDFFAASGLNRYPFMVRDTAFELIDHIEVECNRLYFESGGLVLRARQNFKTFVSDWAGVALALFSLILLLKLFQLVSSFFSS